MQDKRGMNTKDKVLFTISIFLLLVLAVSIITNYHVNTKSNSISGYATLEYSFETSESFKVLASGEDTKVYSSYQLKSGDLIPGNVKMNFYYSQPMCPTFVYCKDKTKKVDYCSIDTLTGDCVCPSLDLISSQCSSGFDSGTCTDKSFKCCEAGKGDGDYLPQYTCTSGECWEKCLSTSYSQQTITLSNYIKQSTTPAKGNYIEGSYYDSDKPTVLTGIGKGFAYCGTTQTGLTEGEVCTSDSQCATGLKCLANNNPTSTGKKCIKDPTSVGCYDSDNGDEPLVNGYVSVYSNGEYYFYEDQCSSDGKTMVEFSCEGTTARRIQYACSPCETKTIGAVCNNASTNCTSTDADSSHPDGDNPGVAGYTTSFGFTYPDRCSVNQENTLIETFCLDGYSNSQFYTCSYGCEGVNCDLASGEKCGRCKSSSESESGSCTDCHFVKDSFEVGSECGPDCMNDNIGTTEGQAYCPDCIYDRCSPTNPKTGTKHLRLFTSNPLADSAEVDSGYIFHSFKSISEFTKLSWCKKLVYVETDSYKFPKGGSYEIVVKSADGKKLHYNYAIVCPIDISTDKYICMSDGLNLDSSYKCECKNAYEDWIRRFEVSLNVDRIYAQVNYQQSGTKGRLDVYFDDINFGTCSCSSSSGSPISSGAITGFVTDNSGDEITENGEKRGKSCSTDDGCPADKKCVDGRCMKSGGSWPTEEQKEEQENLFGDSIFGSSEFGGAGGRSIIERVKCENDGGVCIFTSPYRTSLCRKLDFGTPGVNCVDSNGDGKCNCHTEIVCTAHPSSGAHHYLCQEGVGAEYGDPAPYREEYREEFCCIPGKSLTKIKTEDKVCTWSDGKIILSGKCKSSPVAGCYPDYKYSSTGCDEGEYCCISYGSKCKAEHPYASCSTGYIDDVGYINYGVSDCFAEGGELCKEFKSSACTRAGGSCNINECSKIPGKENQYIRIDSDENPLCFYKDQKTYCCQNKGETATCGEGCICYTGEVTYTGQIGTVAGAAVLATTPSTATSSTTTTKTSALSKFFSSIFTPAKTTTTTENKIEPSQAQTLPSQCPSDYPNKKGTTCSNGEGICCCKNVQTKTSSSSTTSTSSGVFAFINNIFSGGTSATSSVISGFATQDEDGNSYTCDNWDNIYKTKLKDLGIKNPSDEGFYWIVTEKRKDDGTLINAFYQPVFIAEDGEYHTECSEGKCMIVSGSGENQCSTTSECPDACTPNWQCTPSSFDEVPCVNNKQERVCIDLNNCGIAEGKPQEIKDCAEIVEEKQDYNKQSPEIEDKITSPSGLSGKLWWLWLVLALFIAAIAVTLVLLFLNKKKASQYKVPERLMDYIKEASARGMQRPQIKQSLLKVGWKEKMIDAAFTVQDKQRPMQFQQQQKGLFKR